MEFTFTGQVKKFDYEDGAFFRVRKMPIHDGPITQSIDLKAKYIQIRKDGRDSNAIVAAYADCSESNYGFKCQKESKLYGQELKCLTSIFNEKGKSTHCQGLFYLFLPEIGHYDTSDMIVGWCA